jgi:hypothetical protein
VKEVDNNLFFHKGWGAFVQDNSLKMADFLLFRYAGDSNFCVKIYGKDCCEKGVSGDSTKSCTPVCGNENEEEVKIMRNHLKRTREKLVGSGANEVGTKRSVVIHIDSDASDDDIGKPDMHTQFRTKNKPTSLFYSSKEKFLIALHVIILGCRQKFGGFSKAFVFKVSKDSKEC